MRRRFPKIEDCKFLLCDQVRPEANKKLALLGLYAGDRIVFHPKKLGEFPYVLPTVGFVMVAKGGAGRFDGRFRLLTPDGEASYDLELNAVSIPESSSAVILVNIVAVKFNSVGEYTAQFVLEKRKYDFQFSVAHSKPEA